MDTQQYIENIELNLSKLKARLNNETSLYVSTIDGDYVGDVCDIACDMIYGLSQEQMDKVENFCKISEGRYMCFGNFIDNLKLINQAQDHELSKGLVSHTLLTLLFIQRDIDGFEPISISITD